MACQLVAGRLLVTGAVLQRHDRTESPETTPAGEAKEANFVERIKAMVAGVKSILPSLEQSITTTETSKKMQLEMETHLTGWDRVKSLFTRDSNGLMTQDLHNCLHMTEVGLICGFILNGMVSYVKAYEHFLATNDVTNFVSMQDARNKLGRECTKAFFVGGCAGSPKIGIPIGIFMLTHTVVSTYRGRDGILEYPTAGAVTAGLTRWNLGIRGILSGVISGGLTGFFAGCIIYSCLKLTGTSFTNVKYYMFMNQKIDKIAMRDTNSSVDLSSEVTSVLKQRNEYSSMLEGIAHDAKQPK